MSLRTSLHDCCCEAPCRSPRSRSTVLLSHPSRCKATEEKRAAASTDPAQLAQLSQQGCQLVRASGRDPGAGQGKKSRGRRAEEVRVGIKGREVAESFNPAELGEVWLQAGRPGSRGLPSSAGKSPGSSACSAGTGDCSTGGRAGTQATHSLEPVCSCGW